MTYEKREIAQVKGPNDNAILIPTALEQVCWEDKGYS